MGKGKLIVIEGACDGIGKSTQYELLKSNLINKGYEIYFHHFPSYNTYQGKPVENYLEGKFGKPSELSPYFINSLYAVDRAITWNEELKNEYESGKIIVLDRYTTSSIIYQSALIGDIEERKRFIDYIIDFEYEKIGIKKPDMVIFLKASFDNVQNLINQRNDNDGVKNDIHERDISFMKKVYDNAIFVSNYLNWTIIDCNDNNRLRSIEDIQTDLLTSVESILNK